MMTLCVLRLGFLDRCREKQTRFVKPGMEPMNQSPSLGIQKKSHLRDARVRKSQTNLV
jgi:hypothetical protein